MYSDPVLKKALVFTRRGKYDESIKLLEAEVFRYQDSYSYYHVLGLSCLYAGDFGGAFTYFNKAKNIKFRELPPLLGLAVLFLRRGETDRALDLYLDVQDIDPGNRIVKRALNIIKKYGGTEELTTWLDTGKISSLYPTLPWPGFSVKPLPVLVISLAIATVFGVIIGYKNIPVFSRNIKAMEESSLKKTELENAVEMGGVYRYVFTVDEVVSLYGKARKLFNSRRDEAAKRELNRILESNASAAIKNKARILKSYTEAPGFDTLKDRFTYTEVASEPFLYRDCHVLWRGSAANVRSGPDRLNFDLLVGYDTHTVMEGAVPVELDFPAEINPAEALEVLGKVVPLPGDTFKIIGTGIHQLINSK